jgi:hypothetical protein
MLKMSHRFNKRLRKTLLPHEPMCRVQNVIELS